MKALPTILLCALTAAAGFQAGRMVTPSAGPDAAKPNGAGGAQASAGRNNRREGPANDAGGVLREAKPGQPNGALTSSMKGALGNTLESRRLDRWMKLLAAMRPEDGPAIAALLHEEEMAGREFKAEAMAFWQTWAGVDAKGAWAYAQANDTAMKSGSVEALLKSWAFSDPSAAEKAFTELGDSPLREGALAGLMHGLAETNPAAATDYVTKRLPEDLQRDAAVHISGSLIYQLGNEGFQSWFDGISGAEAPAFQKEAARVLLESLSRSTPGAVEKFAMERLDQSWVARPDEQNFTVQMILRNGGSPWDYVSAVGEKQPVAGDPIGLATLAGLRANDPAGALAWVEAHPDNPASDRILAGTAQAMMMRGNEEQAKAIAAKIKEPSLRALVAVPGG